MKKLKSPSFRSVSIKYNSSSTSEVAIQSPHRGGIILKAVSAFMIVWSLMDNAARIKSFATSRRSGNAYSLVGKIGIELFSDR